MSERLLRTPFHARTAEHNLANAWATRGRFTVPAHYGDPRQEAFAPRRSAALIDISATQELHIAGEGATRLLTTACGAIVDGIGIGHSQDVHWCADGGGLRGFGVLWCIAEHDFVLRSADTDIGWFASAAARFHASVRDASAERGLLLLAGPYALPVMVAARLEVASLEPKRHAHFDWGGLAIDIFHCAGRGGYEVSCAPKDATSVFDRLLRAGRLVSLRLAGEETLQLLELEAGLPSPHLDFVPAREPFAHAPFPKALGFNDTEGLNADSGNLVLAGLELETKQPMPFAQVFSTRGAVGRTLRSLYSPALKSAIALAEIAPRHASPGSPLTVRGFDFFGSHDVAARVVLLPFL